MQSEMDRHHMLDDTFYTSLMDLSTILADTIAKEEGIRMETLFCDYYLAKEKEKGKEKLERTDLDILLERLPGCDTIQLIDELTVDFCHFNSFINRQRLAEELLKVPNRKLVPFYSQMVATLSTYMKDLSTTMLDELKNLLLMKAGLKSTPKEEQMLVVMFIGELCKFKVATPKIVFGCFELLIQDNNESHNAEAVGLLRETCEDFLLASPETAAKMTDVLKKMEEDKRRVDREREDREREVKVKRMELEKRKVKEREELIKGIEVRVEAMRKAFQKGASISDMVEGFKRFEVAAGNEIAKSKYFKERKDTETEEHAKRMEEHERAKQEEKARKAKLKAANEGGAEERKAANEGGAEERKAANEGGAEERKAKLKVGAEERKAELKAENEGGAEERKASKKAVRRRLRKEGVAEERLKVSLSWTSTP